MQYIYEKIGLFSKLSDYKVGVDNKLEKMQM